ncbi:bacteriochlorophyll 4-vinyl reductase [Phaeovibrio sulfidiphilus]|uniref:Bacteriochlorophyll 4-vinyl reductase n=1 Tax=Phaeovibrio sulfidiphilus TaxID=1220600 RepID=A0A8J6YKA7_9PROT|nr:putative photosynthetic complex assembly protein PuhE [Phaeovibrio sulfidiphilus]MBE1236055.1 bacteriochlorophyll 4-vinyl reductase [Phaeovibrio sulfidiphilus]
MILTDFLFPVLFVLFTWWFSTGAILFLDGLPRRTYPLTLLAATAVMLVSLYGIQATASLTSLGAVYCAFTCGLLVWGWNEIVFLFGYITGPRRSSCPADATGWARFRYGTQTILYHEIAIVLTFLVLVVLTWGQPNDTALWTFVILWGMRLSAKLNLFLGARNLSESFLPPHLEYLKTYFLCRPVNFLFPFVVTAATMVLAWLVGSAGSAAAAPPADFPAATAFYVFLATLTALGVLEHWFLILPFSSETLWKWGLVSHRARDELKGDVAAFHEERQKIMSSQKLEMSGRIGPNSVIQVRRALEALASPDDIRQVFEKAGLAGYLVALPEKMIPEGEVIALHRALREVLDPAVCEQVMRRAGETTAEYLLENRIPKSVSWLLKRLPPPLAARILLSAISRNAWTFTGTGRFSWKAGSPWTLTIEDSPLAREAAGGSGASCVYYAATFETLFRVLVHPQSRVTEHACAARGDSACVFAVRW